MLAVPLMAAWGRAPPSLVIRDAQDEDAVDLLLLWRELMALHTAVDRRFTLSEHADQRFRDYVETAQSRDDYRVRVAAIGDRPVGFIIACVLPNSPLYRTRWVGYVNDLCVTESARGRGLGRALVRDVLGWMRDRGAESIEMYVAKANPSAAAFWRRIGARDFLERLTLDVDAFERGGR